MELRQLRYFVKVGELLNFTEAARELFVSQSTLSQQIRSLEDELRCSLLVRDSHSVTLTEEGRYFLSDARKTLQQAQQCVDRIPTHIEVVTAKKQPKMLDPVRNYVVNRHHDGEENEELQ